MRNNRNNDSLFDRMGVPSPRPLSLPQSRGLTVGRIAAFGFVGWLISAAFSLGLLSLVIYVAWHFISKFW